MDKHFTKVKTMGSQMEAQMLCNMLQAHNIEAHSRGAKEYASHLTGADEGHYEIVVPEKDVERAQEVIASTQSQPIKPTPIPATRYLQSSLVFAVGGLFLYPYIFNAVSLFSLWGYLKREESMTRKLAWSLLTVVINAAAISIYLKMWTS